MKRILELMAVLTAVCSCGPAAVSSSGPDEAESFNLGYIQVSKDDNLHSISKVKVDNEEIGSYTNIFDYLRGRVPGVQIGPPVAGGTPSITVRGINSINSSTEPLILVDGLEMSDVSGLNPYDVASVDVLKDASTSLYGVRGANGVIIITTKAAADAAKAEAEALKAEKAARKAARKGE